MVSKTVQTDARKTSDHRTKWVEKIGLWSRTNQCFHFDVVRTALKSLVQMYTFELFSLFTDAQVRDLLARIYRKAPEEHSLAI